MVLQVLTLMVNLNDLDNNQFTDCILFLIQPLRTVMNYQYRYGTTTTQAVHTLYENGGWSRYYQGLTPALVQGPVSRFGDTAANAGILALLNSNPYMKDLPDLFKTVFASLAAAAFRMILTPIDTLKTTLQTQGKPGIQILKARVCHIKVFVNLVLVLICLIRSRSMVSAVCGTEHLLQPQLLLSDTTLCVLETTSSHLVPINSSGSGLVPTTTWKDIFLKHTTPSRNCLGVHSSVLLHQ